MVLVVNVYFRLCNVKYMIPMECRGDCEVALCLSYTDLVGNEHGR